MFNIDPFWHEPIEPPSSPKLQEYDGDEDDYRRDTMRDDALEHRLHPTPDRIYKSYGEEAF
jgi:hypothetical protein